MLKASLTYASQQPCMMTRTGRPFATNYPLAFRCEYTTLATYSVLGFFSCFCFLGGGGELHAFKKRVFMSI